MQDYDNIKDRIKNQEIRSKSLITYHDDNNKADKQVDKTIINYNDVGWSKFLSSQCQPKMNL